MKKEGEKAVFECFDTPTFLVNGVDQEFKLTCEKDGFPKNFTWPKCIDPTVTTTTTPKPIPKKPCQCIGDPGVDNERLLDAFCRDVNLPGNVFHYAGYTPPSRKKCGNRTPGNPTEENHCFCSQVEKQAGNLL